MQSRADFIVRVPAALDVTHNTIEYQTYEAGQYYLYGHFDEARAGYEPIYRRSLREGSLRLRRVGAAHHDEQPPR